MAAIHIKHIVFVMSFRGSLMDLDMGMTVGCRGLHGEHRHKE